MHTLSDRQPMQLLQDRRDVLASSRAGDEARCLLSVSAMET